jgi:signal transduction histidine kinase
MGETSLFEKKIFLYGLISTVIFVLIIRNAEYLGMFYNHENYLGIHISLEFFSMAISFSIFTYGWRLLSSEPSVRILFLTFLFFIVGTIDLIHTLTFNGMPYFFGISSVQKATWFWIIARLTEAILMVLMLLVPDKKVKKEIRRKWLLISILYVVTLTLAVFQFEQALPILTIQGQGTTLLKNILEYIVVVLQLGVGFLCLRAYKNTKNNSYLYLFLSAWILLLSELVFTLYISVTDIMNFSGHLFKVGGYYFVLQGVYFSLIDLEKIKKTELIKAKQDLDRIIEGQQGIIFRLIRNGQHFVFTLCRGELLKEIHLDGRHVCGKTIEDISPSEAPKLNEYYRYAWEEKVNLSFEIEPYGLNLFITVKPIIEDGEVVELLGTVSNITKLKDMEEQVRNSEKLGIVGELAAGIAHEVRNPLTTLKGFLQLLNSDLDEHKKTFIQLMLSEVERIEMITDEFMSVARPHVHNYSMEDALEIMNHVYKFLQPQALLKGVQMSLDADENLPSLYCEKNQLKQVFINIVKNSIEAMPQEGGQIHIRVSQRDNEAIIYEFTDNGVGIPEEFISKIGQPFFTSKAGGNGLGLMMSKKIIDQHQGNMHIATKIGEGTTFTITLPIVQPMELANENTVTPTSA